MIKYKCHVVAYGTDTVDVLTAEFDYKYYQWFFKEYAEVVRKARKYIPTHKVVIFVDTSHYSNKYEESSLNSVSRTLKPIFNQRSK